jgi:hypothetical protein
MALLIWTVVAFIVAWIISTVIIYVVTRLFGEKKDITTALIAALAGTIIYTIVYYFIGHSLITAIIAGIAWLIALRALYSIGWLKSLATAIVIWIVATIVGWFLPTLGGPV